MIWLPYPIVTLEQNLLGLVPIAIFLCALQVGTVVSVEVLEDPVLVLQASICPHGMYIVHSGQVALLSPRRLGGR